MRLAIVGIALLGIALSTTAEAATHHKRSHRNHYTHVYKHHHIAWHRYHRKTYRQAANKEYSRKVISYLPHPSGCPRIKFCGCGAWKALTGQTVSKGTWALANYWPNHYKGFTPIAWWNGHVAIVRKFLGNGFALVEDYNSGGHKSRLHIRNIAHARILGNRAYANG